MIDTSHCKVQPHTAGAKRGNQEMSRTKGELNTKVHLAVDVNGLPIRVLITDGSRANCKKAAHLIAGILDEILLADRGYDTNKIIAYAIAAGIEVVVPPKTSKTEGV